MSNHIWLRAENEKTAPSRGNPNLLETERRTVLAPEDAAKLVKAGYRVTVEKSAHRIFHDTDYSAAGYEARYFACMLTVSNLITSCELVPTGSWESTAPQDAVILGLRSCSSYLPELSHTHVHFGHAFKKQKGLPFVLPFVLSSLFLGTFEDGCEHINFASRSKCVQDRIDD